MCEGVCASTRSLVDKGMREGGTKGGRKEWGGGGRRGGGRKVIEIRIIE